MVQKWASIPVLAQHVGVSDNTVRRYIKRFPDHFLSKTADGVKKFPVESVEVIKRIYALYQHEGRSKSEIEKILRVEFPPAIDIQTEDDIIDIMPPPATMQAEMMLTVMDKIDRMTEAFERVADALERQNERDKRITELEKKLNLLISTDKQPPAEKPEPEVMPADIPTPTETRQQIISRIVKMRDGGLSWRAIAEQFNDEGVPTFSGRGKWQFGTVATFYRQRVKN